MLACVCFPNSFSTTASYASERHWQIVRKICIINEATHFELLQLLKAGSVWNSFRSHDCEFSRRKQMDIKNKFLSIWFWNSFVFFVVFFISFKGLVDSPPRLGKITSPTASSFACECILILIWNLLVSVHPSNRPHLDDIEISKLPGAPYGQTTLKPGKSAVYA